MAKVERNKVTNVTLYTGGNGRESCYCNCPGCSQKERNQRYQGTIEQATEMLDLLPNLEELYVFGNPDVAVDTSFCNRIFRMAIERGIHVSACTSGVGGKKTLKTLLEGIPANMVNKLSFSFDSVHSEDMDIYKGIRYPFETAIEGLSWAISNGYHVRVQPTIWQSNCLKVEELMEYFIKLGVDRFRFHMGSIEHGVPSDKHNHVTVDEMKKVHSQIDNVVNRHPDIKVRCPSFFWLGDSSQYHHCQHPSEAKDLLVFFSKEGIRATITPIVAEFTSDVTWILGQEIDFPEIKIEGDMCPFSKLLTGGISSQCRYQSRLWNWK